MSRLDAVWLMIVARFPAPKEGDGQKASLSVSLSDMADQLTSANFRTGRKEVIA